LLLLFPPGSNLAWKDRPRPPGWSSSSPILKKKRLSLQQQQQQQQQQEAFSRRISSERKCVASDGFNICTQRSKFHNSLVKDFIFFPSCSWHASIYISVYSLTMGTKHAHTQGHQFHMYVRTYQTFTKSHFNTLGLLDSFVIMTQQPRGGKRRFRCCCSQNLI
jgi:hypothetical protein